MHEFWEYLKQHENQVEKSLTWKPAGIMGLKKKKIWFHHSEDYATT